MASADRSQAAPIADVLAPMQTRLDDLPAHAGRRPSSSRTYRRTTAAVGEAGSTGAGSRTPPGSRRGTSPSPTSTSTRSTPTSPATGRGRRGPGGWPSTRPPTCRRCATCCSASTRTSTTTCRRPCSAVITDDDFADPAVLDRRRRDHERIDGVLAEPGRRRGRRAGRSARRAALLDRVLQPLNRLARSGSCARPAQKVWHNTLELQRARARRPGQRTPCGSASWRCSAPPGSPTCSPRPGAAAAGGRRLRRRCCRRRRRPDGARGPGQST